MNPSDAVIQYIEDHRHDLIERLQLMIRTKSVNPAFDPTSAGEQAMADLVSGFYDRMGVAVEQVEAVPGRPNVVATWPGTQGAPKLLVNCHLDTHAADVSEWVDPYTGEVLHEWSVDPFGGAIKDGRMYGRGTADHKSPIAAILMAIEALKAQGVRLKGTVTCIHDADEETGGQHGMRYLSEHYPFEFDMALYACTSEFTSLGRTFFSAMGADNIIRSFSGWQTYKIRVTGQNLHNLTPKVGYGAVEAGLLLLERLKPLMEKVNSTVDPLEGSGQPPMRITGIDCAPRAAFHHQARWCEIVVNRRITPSVTLDKALEEVQAVVSAHNDQMPDNQTTLTVVRSIPPAITEEDHPVIKELEAAVRRVTGREPNVVGLPSSVGISTFLADHPIPTVLFGYGFVNMHHAIDEHIDCDAVVETAKVYAVALMNWLGVVD